MGCGQSNTITYNKREELTNDFINPEIETLEESLKNLNSNTSSTINDIERAFSLYSTNHTMGYRKTKNGKDFDPNFTFMTYSEIEKAAKKLSTLFLYHEFCKPTKFEDEEGEYRFVGIFARNCLEWFLTDIACQMNDITSVTFYATLGEKAFEHITDQTKLSTLCISGDNIETFLKYHQAFNLCQIKKILIYDYTLELRMEYIKELEDKGFQVLLFTELLEDEPPKYNLNYAKPNSILTICYTSGTTGIPKGVKLSQNNVALMIENVFVNAGVDYSPSETVLLYLPLAHVMERLNMIASFVFGVKTGFLSGDVRTTLSEDILILKPTVFVAVPRVLQLFRQKILDQIEKMEDGCKKSMALRAIRVKRENFRNKGCIKDSFYDSTVFSKIREKFGGRIKYFVTGSAPLAEEVATDIKIFFSAPIIEAYGLTECCGACITSKSTDFLNISAGGCLKVCKVKLVDVPEMNYNQNTLLNGEISPSGEICIYGPTLFKGYFRNPQATRECMDKDGWFHTGDIGRIIPENKGIKIIDRKKEIFKLAQGEYIAPTKLESIYSKCKYVAAICVYGNSYKNFLVAIVVPNRESIFEFLKLKGKVQEGNLKELKDIERYFTDEDLIKEIKSSFDSLAKESNFNSLEKIQKFHLSEKEFTIQNGCFTPTLKLARNVIANNYKKEIEQLYL